MLGPIQNILTQLLDQGVTLVPVLAAIAILIYGGVLLFGNHQKGKEGLFFVVVGTAVMLGSKTIAAGIHP